MHQQILFSRRRVTVRPLQALVLSVKVGHQNSCHALTLLRPFRDINNIQNNVSLIFELNRIYLISKRHFKLNT